MKRRLGVSHDYERKTMNLRCLRQAANFTQDQLSGLPIDLSADWSQIALSRRISELYAQNVAAPDTRAMGWNPG